MSVSRPFAWSSTGPPAGTGIIGQVVYGINPNLPYANNWGGLRWWNGPDENLGYIIVEASFATSQPTPNSGENAKVQFWRSKVKTMNSFVSLANFISEKYDFNVVFYSGAEAKATLEFEGFYTSYTESVPSGCTANTVINLAFPNLDVSECQILTNAPDAFFCSETSGVDVGDTWYLDLSMTTPYLEGIVLEEKFGPSEKIKYTINSSGTITNKETCPTGSERYFYLENTDGVIPSSAACSSTTPLLNVVFLSSASMCSVGIVDFTSDTSLAPSLDNFWLYDSVEGTVRAFSNASSPPYTLIGPCLFPCGGTFANTINVSSTDVCSTVDTSFFVTGNGPAGILCDNTEFVGAGFASLPSGTYTIKIPFSIDKVTVTTNGTNTATNTSYPSCPSC